MIRRQGEYRSEIRETMRGGNGAVQIEHFWSKDELGSKTRLCARLTLRPGASIGTHTHDGEEEVFVVIRGKARVQDGDQVADLGPGDTILTGDGNSHAVESIGDEPLELLAVIVRY